MFVGDAAQALGRLPEAVAAFERALRVFPNAQSARMALAHANRTIGNRAGATHALLPVLVLKPAERGTDPWTNYYAGDAVHLDQLWEDLRTPLRGRP
jgi:hypothetical protein